MSAALQVLFRNAKGQPNERSFSLFSENFVHCVDGLNEDTVDLMRDSLAVGGEGKKKHFVGDSAGDQYHS